jgi:YesN/AraC family two-component response regulator
MMDLAKLKDKVVLYVEDDEAIMTSFNRILIKVFGKVYTASNGEEGLEAFKEHKDEINYVITDIKMPKMDGLTMASKIREINPDMPCILTTAHAEYDYFLQAEDIGIYRYITKPLNVNELLEAITKID